MSETLHHFVEDMTYVLLEYHPYTQKATVGDSDSDPRLMHFLDAVIEQGPGCEMEYRTTMKPRLILNKLETRGYKVVAMTSTCTGSGGLVSTSWTLRRKAD
ncbi:hypothetical protein BV898_01590 [Hypsibius exemplaris]|uniref:GTP cyclohydrolase 1 feedback regulatory protein n=1 Tax=Hypsibius exemplaris TaxID=2072580 RepID=A0A1W0XAH0_HYPEX|nr:hypothetical protein BV898_01590 [Hypsibius exemplaris]